MVLFAYGTARPQLRLAARKRLGIAEVRRYTPVSPAVSAVPPSLMARMHTRRRGSSASDRPPANEPPEWSDVDTDEIEERVIELAEAGHDPSVVGLKLRDEGVRGTPIPNVKLATGKKVTEILEENDAKSSLPEDLRNLLTRAVGLHEHIEEHPQDAQNKRALQNTESKVRRLVEYYRGDEIPADFRYSIDQARRLLGQ